MVIFELKAAKFIFMLNFIMAKMNNLFDRQNPQPTQKTSNESQLSQTEIEILLSILKDASFKIKDIEILYKTLIKLQTQHQELKK